MLEIDIVKVGDCEVLVVIVPGGEILQEDLY